MPPDSTNNWVFLVLGFCSGFLFTVTNGSPTPPPTSDVNIQTSAPSIQEGLTSDFSLNCSFPHNQTSNIPGLMSIILSKTGDFETDDFKEIAALTFLSGQTVEVKDDVGGAQVKGHLEQAQGMSFISYQWQYPTSQVEGKYQCSVHGMDSHGHPVVSSTVAVVEKQTVSIDTALTRLHACEKSKHQLQSELSLTKSQMNTTQTELSLTKSQMNTTQSELSLIKSQMNTTEIELVQTKLLLNKTQLKLNLLHTIYVLNNVSSTVYNNHIYYTSDRQPINVTLFQQKCQEKGGYLAEINDEKEYTAIQNFVISLNDKSSLYYIGITDLGHTGRWTFLTSGEDAFVKWAAGQPDGVGSDHCAVWYHVSSSSKPQWFDYVCVTSSRTASYMCEVDLQDLIL